MIGGVIQSDTAIRFQRVAVVGGVINQRQNLRPMCSELAMSRSLHRKRRDATISPSEFVHAAQEILDHRLARRPGSAQIADADSTRFPAHFCQSSAHELQWLLAQSIVPFLNHVIIHETIFRMKISNFLFKIFINANSFIFVGFIVMR